VALGIETAGGRGLIVDDCEPPGADCARAFAFNTQNAVNTQSAVVLVGRSKPVIVVVFVGIDKREWFSSWRLREFAPLHLKTK
jgi:hypothetical protein